MIPKYRNCGEWLVPYNAHCVNCGMVHVYVSNENYITRAPYPREMRTAENRMLREAAPKNIALWERKNVK